MRKKTLIAVPVALVLIAGSAMWVRAAENDAADRACADIVGGEAEYTAPAETVPDLPVAGVEPARLVFNEILAAPSCVDVQYGLVVLKEAPLGGAPSILTSQVVPGDGISEELQFDLTGFTPDTAQENVCIYLYTLGSTGGTTTTPSNGNPHSQTITAASTELIDRAPDGANGLYCNAAGPGSGGRTYN